ncbi:MAG TPA: DUF116 domain-containing protein [Deltaproteobacteria bacterium]|nr:DUF116 domain-containing protein [Deltaproteobacteria bacterium]
MKARLLNNKEEWKGSPESIPYRPNRKIIIGVLTLIGLGLSAIGFVMWYVPTIGLKNLHPSLPYIFGAIVGGTLVAALTGLVLMGVALIKGKIVVSSPAFRGVLIKVFLPLMVLVGGIAGIPRIKIEQAFIELNNRLVREMIRRRGKGFNPDRLVLLMPHCIQYDNCRIKVTRDVRNCVDCGRCEIGDLIEISDKYGVKLFVLTGGTVARRKLVEYRPDAVVAVACERDLTSGVQDAYPLPVIAIINKRPNGYCIETGVDIEDVKRAIEDLLNPMPSPQTG